METNYDVFAGLTDFCDNYTVDVAAAPRVVAEIADLSDSEEENRFLENKAKEAPPTRRKAVPKTKERKTAAKKPTTDVTAEKTAAPNAPARRVSNNGNDSNATEAVRRTRSNYVPDEFNFEEPTASRTASRRTRGSRGRGRGSNMTIEEHMFYQTLAILQTEFNPTQPQAQRGRSRGGRGQSRGGRGQSRGGRGPNDACNSRTNSALNASVNGMGDSTRSTSRTTEIVILESDDDDLETSGLSSNLSFDIENAEILVKVKWGDKIECVPHRKHQKFSDLMKKFADRENVGIKDIFLNLNDRIIEPDDTPDSIDYKIVQFLSGRIIQSERVVTTKKKDPNAIKIKIQSDAFKRPMDVYIKSEQAFKILYIKCSEELHVPCDHIKLSFDGDPLILTQTPNDLDFEGGEVVDCRIVK